MYEHIVLLKLKEEAGRERQEEAVRTVYAFKDSIPGIVDLSAGINVTEETENAHGYTLAIRVTFDNTEACRNYAVHPLHQQFLAGIGPFVDQVVVADYPILHA